MNALRFACGAESPPFEGSFPDWVRSQIKDLKGYALGHRRKDGRYRVMVWDLDRETITPRHPDGTPARCLTCPCPKEAGRLETAGKPKRSSPFRQIKVLCYPEEVPTAEGSTPCVAGLHGEGQCEKIEHDGRTGYLHGPNDDSAYSVDGVRYCGRCHGFMQ